MAEAYQFVKAVLRHWLAGITGGIVGAVIAFSATFFQPLPKQIVFGAIVGYLVFAGFFAWREQYRKANLIAKPLERRDKLDQLAKRGEDLLERWVKRHEQPIRETGKWSNSVEEFVREHFTISQFDAFMDASISPDELEALRNQVRAGVVFQHVDTNTFAFAVTITQRLKALKELRTQIS